MAVSRNLNTTFPSLYSIIEPSKNSCKIGEIEVKDVKIGTTSHYLKHKPSIEHLESDTIATMLICDNIYKVVPWLQEVCEDVGVWFR
jgi:hypothetical protein